MTNKNINNHDINNIIEDSDLSLMQCKNEDLCKKCPEPKLQHCCNVMIEHKTHLNPPVFCNSKIHSKIKTDVKIEKVCAGTIIISGIFHKILYYKALLRNGTINPCCEKHIHIPFNCFINIDEANEDDKYEVTGHDILCTYAKTTDINSSSNKPIESRCMHIEKTLIKICIMRK